MKSILFLLAALSLSTALAHTEVTAIVPAANATVAAPKTITVTLSEPVNLRFSTFRVLRIGAGQTPTQAAAQALAAKADMPTLASLPTKATGLAATVRVPLKAALPAGPYVIAWTLLSDDGHPVSGFSAFTVK
ncbi:copper resistance protein CopC [Deinococcus yunweiensis]|uniref:copper resistance CopC family protein n=1 Tax=Deinococcus yunweiensis TaxID=367282 RepID=UPI00398E52FF